MKKYFLKDKSLENIDEDQFRYQDFANNLRRIIECNETPFNVAVIGKWGLGKSSLVNMVLAPLRKNKNEFLICEINAWKYEKDEIGKAFIKELWEKISEKKVFSFHFFHKEYNDIIKKAFENDEKNVQKNKGVLSFCIYSLVVFFLSVIMFAIYCAVSNKFYGIQYLKGAFFWKSVFLRYCKNMGSILIIPIIIWLGKLFMDKLNKPSYKNYEISFPLATQADYEVYLENLLQKFYKNNPNVKIIVVIDDLDRLSAEKIVEALDALKLFMEYDKFIFIVPFDDEILKNALKRKRINSINTPGSDYNGEMMLDKIFQYSMYLPQLIKYDMRNYAFEICREECIDFINEYCSGDAKLFEEIVGKILIHSNVSTPRQVKKIINTFVENVMIACDRERAGKVAEKFATEKMGMQTIAKISVLQSDYNEFYDLLFQDAGVIKEILDVHRSAGDKLPSKLLQRYFDKGGKLKNKYEPLVNYLIFTENIGHSNITPYLYMAQTRTGVLVGDKSQQDFMAALESCNLVTVKQLMGQTPIFTSFLLEQLKYNELPVMGNIIISAIDCFDIVQENDKSELAVAIVERIPELINMVNDFRYDLLNVGNMMLLSRMADSDVYNELVECALDKSENAPYKNRVALVYKIAKIQTNLSDATLDKYNGYTKKWMLSKDTGVHDIIEYTISVGEECVAKTFGIEYIQKVAVHVTENDDFKDELLEQFGNVLHIFLKNNSITAIIDVLSNCYDFPILHKMLDSAIDKSKYSEIENASDIAKKIVSIGTKNIHDVYGYRILSKLSYTVATGEEDIFDDFFVEAISEDEFADMIEGFSKKNSLQMLPKTVEKLNANSVELNGYSGDMRRILKLYTDSQQKVFWQELAALCDYSSNREYNVLSDLVLELSKDTTYDSEIIDIIENHVIAKWSSYYNQNNYFMFANQVVGEYKKKLSQNSIDQYCNAIMKVISIDTSAVANAYRTVSTLVSEDVWCKNVSTLLKYVSQETYSVIYDIIIGRIELFSDENDNLNELVDFLVDYIDLSEKPDGVINTINNKFSAIGNLDILISKLMNIQYDEENASVKLAKILDSSSMDDITKIIVNEYHQDEMHAKKLLKIFSRSENYSGKELIFRANENKESMNKNDILCMLKFCSSFISESNISSCLNIITYLVENYLEKDVCIEILLLIGSFSEQAISKARADICEVLVDIFRKSSSDDVRRKCSMLIKDKRLSKKVRGIFNEEEMKDYKAYLS